ncbi:MAG TPA: PH domain-containing protein [Patescibacteria group bacterium]|nr:PH domain-containing protein [Patescibacteria group bacterium]
MVTLQEVENQLKRIGASFRLWGRPEMLELVNVLIPGEQIQACLNGRWEGGFAMLCATDQRLLLVDKKPMYLTMEDVRYDMVSEVDYSHRLLNATVRICAPNKTLRFLSFNNVKLRQLTTYVQQRVMEMRQQHMMQQQPMPLSPQPSIEAAEPQFVSLRPVETQAVSNFMPFTGYNGSTVPKFQQTMNPYTSNPFIVRRRSFGFKR